MDGVPPQAQMPMPNAIAIPVKADHTAASRNVGAWRADAEQVVDQDEPGDHGPDGSGSHPDIGRGDAKLQEQNATPSDDVKIISAST
jgi:hypothetical protein